MSKEDWKPGTMIYPLPALLVSCGNKHTGLNLVTVSWTGTICTNPPMCYISLRRERHSYHLIELLREFVLNLTTADLAKVTDWCGVRSGKEHDKFHEMGLTPEPSTVVSVPGVAESPLCIECRVTEIKPLGSHDMFIAEVVNVRADSSLVHPDTGKFMLEESRPLVYLHGHYYHLGLPIGKFGWSVEKKKRQKT